MPEQEIKLSFADAQELRQTREALKEAAQALRKIADDYHMQRWDQRIEDMGNKKSLGDKEWEKSEPLIHNSFESWRDYLYKYALAMGAVLGFLVSLVVSQKAVLALHQPTINLGLLLLGGSVIISFCMIFLTLYLERLFIAAHVSFAQSMGVGFGKERPGIKNPVTCVELTIRERIRERETRLSTLTDTNEIEEEKKGIALDKREASLMKYVGLKFTKYEHIRIIWTLLVLALSFSGLFLIIQELLGQ